MLRKSLLLAVLMTFVGLSSAPWAKAQNVGPVPAAVNDPNTLAAQPPNIFGLKFRQAGVGRVLVESVDPNGVAATAGVQIGDQILSVASLPVDSVAVLEKRLLTVGPEEQLEFSFYRTDKPFNVVLTALNPAAGSRPVSAAPRANGPSAPVEQTNILGMTLNETPTGTVTVSRVSPNTPAAAAGVQAGDLILALAGHPASPLTDLMPFAVKLVRTEKRTSPIAIEVQRQGKTATLSVPPGGQAAGASGNAQTVVPPGQMGGIIGLVLRDISPNTVTVVNVYPGSPADVSGIKPGDTIAAMDRQSVATSQEMMGIIGAHRIGDTIEVQVVRAGKSFLTQLTIVPRLVDLAVTSAQQATGSTSQEVAALEQQIAGLRQQLGTLQLQLQQVQQAQANADQSRSEHPAVSATNPAAPAPAPAP
ncbi:MAG TPA: PDZ domain-containing protein [Pirellulales bacterium]